MSLDLRAVLNNPAVYNLFQKMSRTREYRQRFMQRVPIMPNDRVLEVGCGPGTNVEYLPKDMNVSFVGCDADADYIDHAKASYGDRAQFFNAPVGDLGNLGLERFDTAVAWGLLHHIDDAQVETLAGEVSELLDAGGHFCTFDPCFTAEQGLMARVLTACDRGRYVRYPEHYARLLRTHLPTVSVDVWPPGTVLPYSVTVIVASKN